MRFSGIIHLVPTNAPPSLTIVVVIILIQWNINQHHHWTKCPPPHWKTTMQRHQVIHLMKRRRRRPKKMNRRLQSQSYLHTIPRIISIPPWEERIYEFCLPWLSVATLVNSQITRTHCFPRQRHTILKSNLTQQHSNLKLQDNGRPTALLATNHAHLIGRLISAMIV